MEKKANEYEENIEADLIRQADLTIGAFEQACAEDSILAHNIEDRSTNSPAEILFGDIAALPEGNLELARFAYPRMGRSENPEVRYWASHLLSELLPADIDSGLELVEILLQDPDPNVRQLAFSVFMNTAEHSEDLSFRRVKPIIAAYLTQWHPDAYS